MMTEPNGFEYVLENTQQRTTSIIVRKAPNNITLVQRTPAGTVSIELSEEAKTRMLEVIDWRYQTANLANPVSGQNLRDGISSLMGIVKDINDNPEKHKRKPGRPPKAQGEAA